MHDLGFVALVEDDEPVDGRGVNGFQRGFGRLDVVQIVGFGRVDDV